MNPTEALQKSVVDRLKLYGLGLIGLILFYLYLVKIAPGWMREQQHLQSAVALLTHYNKTGEREVADARARFTTYTRNASEKLAEAREFLTLFHTQKDHQTIIARIRSLVSREGMDVRKVHFQEILDRGTHLEFPFTIHLRAGYPMLKLLCFDMETTFKGFYYREMEFLHLNDPDQKIEVRIDASINYRKEI